MGQRGPIGSVFVGVGWVRQSSDIVSLLVAVFGIGRRPAGGLGPLSIEEAHGEGCYRASNPRHTAHGECNGHWISN